MNTHSITETIRCFLLETVPDGLFVHTPISKGELVLPYVLLNCVADSELIPGNKTWECTMEVSLHSAAYDEKETSMREQFAALCSLLEEKRTLKAINEAASDFILYSLSLKGIEEAQAQENNFIQTARFRVILQF